MVSSMLPGCLTVPSSSPASEFRSGNFFGADEVQDTRMRSMFRRAGLLPRGGPSFLREEYGVWSPVPLERFGLRVLNTADKYYEEECTFPMLPGDALSSFLILSVDDTHKRFVELNGKIPLYAPNTFL